MSQSVSASVNKAPANNAKPNKKKQVVVTATDSRTTSDALARKVLHLKGFSDSLSMSDNVGRNLLFTRSLISSLSFSDAIARTIALIRSRTDTETFSENFVTARVRNLTDALSFSDAIARTVILGRKSTDSETFAEGVATPPHGVVRLVLDNESLTELLSFNLNPAARTATDTVTFSEDSDPLVVFTRFMSDSAPTAETLQSFSQVFRALFDSMTVSELPVKISALSPLISDSFVFSESLISNVIVQPPNSTTVQFADAVGTPKDPATVAVDLIRLTTEQQSYSDVVTANVTLVAKTITDSFTFSDSVIGVINNLPFGIIGKSILNFVAGGGSVTIVKGGTAVTLSATSSGSSVNSTSAATEIRPVSGSGKVN